MPRKTKRTVRRYPPNARAILVIANELDRRSRALIKLAEKIADVELDARAWQASLTQFPEVPQ